MTPEDIIRMARSVRDGGHWSALDLINFGLFVAAAEREACAQVCEEPEYMDAMSASKGSQATPLYTAPPQRKPLTEEEIWALYYALPSDDFERSDRIDFARAIERAHGIGEEE